MITFDIWGSGSAVWSPGQRCSSMHAGGREEPKERCFLRLSAGLPCLLIMPKSSELSPGRRQSAHATVSLGGKLRAIA